MMTFALCATVCAVAQSRHPARTVPDPKPSGPTVLIDTTLGRITCSLYSEQAPTTTANFVGLATGSKDWMDNASHTVQQGRPFYDGAAFFGISDAALAGDRLGGSTGLAGDPFPAEKSGLGYDRAGRLVMARNTVGPQAGKGGAIENSSSLFFVSAYADDELAGRGGTVFGQCDEASLPVIRALTHALLATDNHPNPPLAVNHITVLQAGAPVPSLATNVAPSAITPQPAPPAMAALPSPEPTGPTAVLELTVQGKPLGQLRCRLFTDEAPIGTANFAGLVAGTKDWKSPATHTPMHGRRFYDGLSFGRDIPDFMIQNADLPGDPKGGGDLGFHFGNEIVPGLTFDRAGRLAYANAGPDTNQSEFFITEHAVHRLDGRFTIFGQCDDASVKLVETIARMPRDAHNKPLTRVVIKTITLVPGR
jgi:cyclophilin family peptidyl-prolyl cis-trans isomerase